jgi:hypothetical protein
MTQTPPRRKAAVTKSPERHRGVEWDDKLECWETKSRAYRLTWFGSTLGWWTTWIGLILLLLAGLIIDCHQSLVPPQITDGS